MIPPAMPTMAVLAVLFMILPPLARPLEAATCRSTLGAAHHQPLDPARPNQALFSEAVAHHVNRARCRQGLAPLRADAHLTRMAAGHSQAMAQYDVLSHRVARRGHETLRQRLSSAGIRWRQVGENIATNFVYQLGNRPVSASRPCQFRDASTGVRVGRHSYASLAETAVAQWLASPGHRKNVLSRGFGRIGSGVGVRPGGPMCGKAYLTQAFAD